MIAIATLLVAFPAGFFVRNRLAAFVTYIAVFAYCFTFQGMYLLPMFTHEAGPNDWPKNDNKWPISYFVMTASIYVVGFGLVALGHHVGRKRRLRRAAAAEEPVSTLAQR